jgi:hypothetical protein
MYAHSGPLQYGIPPTEMSELTGEVRVAHFRLIYYINRFTPIAQVRIVFFEARHELLNKLLSSIMNFLSEVEQGFIIGIEQIIINLISVPSVLVSKKFQEAVALF